MKSSLLTDAVIRIALRSGRRQSSVPVCPARWLELPETAPRVWTVSIRADLEHAHQKDRFVWILMHHRNRNDLHFSF